MDKYIINKTTNRVELLQEEALQKKALDTKVSILNKALELALLLFPELRQNPEIIDQLAADAKECLTNLLNQTENECNDLQIADTTEMRQEELGEPKCAHAPQVPIFTDKVL